MVKNVEQSQFVGETLKANNQHTDTSKWSPVNKHWNFVMNKQKQYTDKGALNIDEKIKIWQSKNKTKYMKFVMR